MDSLEALGRDILGQLPTFKVYGDLHQAQKQGHGGLIEPKSFSFGPHERQMLDLYTTPSSSTSSNLTRPILVFFYGGGLITGERQIPDTPYYRNLATFFATHHEMDVVVPDYRLISHEAKYPSGGEDVGLALAWIAKEHPGREVYAVANSAGGIHLATWLFGGGKFAEERTQLLSSSSLRLTKVVMASVPMRLFPEQAMKEQLSTYIGSNEEIAAVEPTNLMILATQDLARSAVAKLPKILTLYTELDPDMLGGPSGEFAALWRLRGGRGDLLCVDGHNHFSNMLTLGLGIEKEEAWGHVVAEWLKRA